MKLRNPLVALALAAGLASCGGSSTAHAPTREQLPILPSARIAVQARQCDKGHSAYCAIQLVLVERTFTDNYEFLLAERGWLHDHGWTGANGDTALESAADSPGHKLHLTYATADGELQGWDQNWIKRPSPIVHALSRSIFDGVPALSMMVELDSGTS